MASSSDATATSIIERSGRRVITSELIVGQTLREVCAAAPQELRDHYGVALNRAMFVSIYGHQLFNADPHPGNYLFLPNGRVAFLDFGCVQRYPRETVLAFRSVREYVLLGRTPYIGYLASERRRDFEAADAAMARLDLGELARRRLSALSGGERQRVVLARALAQQAPLLLLDEPTTSLDVGRQQQVLEIVDELRASEGLTVLSAMHDLTLAGQYADRLLLLDRGRLVASGAAEDVLTRAFERLTSAARGAREVRLMYFPSDVRAARAARGWAVRSRHSLPEPSRRPCFLRVHGVHR